MWCFFLFPLQAHTKRCSLRESTDSVACYVVTVLGKLFVYLFVFVFVFLWNSLHSFFFFFRGLQKEQTPRLLLPYTVWVVQSFPRRGVCFFLAEAASGRGPSKGWRLQAAARGFEWLPTVGCPVTDGLNTEALVFWWFGVGSGVFGVQLRLFSAQTYRLACSGSWGCLNMTGRIFIRALAEHLTPVPRHGCGPAALPGASPSSLPCPSPSTRRIRASGCPSCSLGPPVVTFLTPFFGWEGSPTYSNVSTGGPSTFLADEKRRKINHIHWGVFFCSLEPLEVGFHVKGVSDRTFGPKASEAPANDESPLFLVGPCWGSSSKIHPGVEQAMIKVRKGLTCPLTCTV